MIGVDLFSGAGGMSLGARWAGISVRVAVELNRYAAETHARNHPECLTVNGDVRHIANLLNSRGRREKLVLFGGPPCQGFSTSNQRTRGPDNEKNLLYREFTKLVGKLQPDWVVFENVTGILETSSNLYVVDIDKQLRKLGYDTVSGVLNAVDFGVPQHRKRFFLIGGRGRQAPTLPMVNRRPEVSVGEAISDLPILRNGSADYCLPYRRDPNSAYSRKMRGGRENCLSNFVSSNAEYVLRRYKCIPQGGNWENIPKKLMRNYSDVIRCHTGIYHRLHLNRPSVVIGNFRKNMLIHPTQHRGLSIREAARLQSFPDWYEFVGSIGLLLQLVGNAVPPLLAKAVFQNILESE